jgi:GDPmannose 4,6-dehydratase
LHQIELNKYDEVFEIIKKINPDEIYNLSGQTSVGSSFQERIETHKSIFNVSLNILESIKNNNPKCKLFNAGSGEIYGGNGLNFSDETSPIKPLSPYGVAKAAMMFLSDNYRDSFGMFCVTGIAFNHESPLRSKNFITKKIITGAYDISKGLSDQLLIGNISIKRDWGWAPDYVIGMHKMIQLKDPENLILATGKLNSLENFIDKSFKYFNLNYKDHIKISEEFKRPSDVIINGGNPNMSKSKLNWSCEKDIDEIIHLMCKNIIK